MRAHTPQQIDASRRRSSISSNHRTSMGSSLPMPRTQSRIAMARAANTQPAFDFMTGAESTARPPSRGGTFGHSTRVSSGGQQTNISAAETDADYEKRRKELDDLKAEVKTLQYTIDNHKQEEELAKLRHDSELRDARRKGEEDFKQRQSAEAERSKAVRQYDALLKEVTEVRDTATNEKAALERRVREVEESKRVLEEEVEDVKSEREQSLRVVERKAAELESRNETLQRTVEDLQQDSDRRETLLQDAQQQLADKDAAYGALEAEVLRLKALTGDADTLGIIKRELSEQVTHIKKLEVFNRKQGAELDHYKRLHASVEVVEEEKRSLQRKVNGMEALQHELREAQLQRQRLEDERLAWTAYLGSQASDDDQYEFDSPEALARALVEERLQRVALIERLGAVEAELSGKDTITQGLEAEKSSLEAQIEKLKSSGGGGNDKVRQRLERQRGLAVKEVEYLRAQLKAMDDEDITFQPENVDETKSKRIQELEGMIDLYRQEVQTLTSELSTRETIPSPTSSVGSKRPREETTEDNERLGQLSRKNRKLQDSLSTLQASFKLLQKELSVAQERLTAASTQSKTRVLSLRSNPTSDFEAIKQSTLTTLRKENADLLAQLQSGPSFTSVPFSTLEASQTQIRSAQDDLASERKKIDRLKKVWGAKTAEFRELVISLLGWHVVFMPNGRTKVTSDFYPSKGEEENSIEFDGEKGTMKVSGGTQSAFAGRIREQINFWVHERRGGIPCLLAALTLEFYEEMNKDKTLRIE